MYQYIFGLEPDRLPFQIIFGGLFHSSKAEFYRTGSSAKAVKILKEEAKEARDHVEDPSRYGPFMLLRGPKMIEKWIRVIGNNDLKVYKILAVEKIISVVLPNGYRFTMKPDVVLKGPSGVYLFDSKTSWYSANLQAEQLETSDQTTAYLYGWNHAHPKQKAIGLVPDCIYWSVNTEDPEKIECTRSKLVTRSERELKEWEEGTISDLMDMASRVRALKKAGDAATFPRTTSYCLSYNRLCEYINICRHRIEGVPPGFHEESWSGKKQILEMKK